MTHEQRIQHIRETLMVAEIDEATTQEILELAEQNMLAAIGKLIAMNLI